MKTGGRISWLCIAAVGVVGGLILGLHTDPGPLELPFVARPLPRETTDLAVACLASGEVQPPVAELSDADFAAIVEIVGRLIQAYELADFDSFLALRAGDLEQGFLRPPADLESLRGFARELSVPREDLRGGWVDVLRSFWNAYYGGSRVARFAPEGTRIVLHDEGSGERSLESWNESFLALRDRVPGPWIRHELVLRHRRGIAQVAHDPGSFRWLDLELGFETREGSGARLVARFVWDGVLDEWYLHDAVSVYAAGDRSQRHLIL